MAVLVRSTRLAGPLQRALADAGVPVETPADERPLTREPVLDPLLSLLHAGAGLRPLDEDTAVALLCSPLGGADALDLRRLRRALRERERAAGGSRRSGELLIECLRDPALAKSLDAQGDSADQMLAAPRRIAGLLARVRAATDAAEAPEEVLWAVWSASRWREELERLVRRPGNAPPALLRHVDRQLDAVVALFEAAARFTDRLPAAGLAVFLKGLLDQEIPADPLSQRSFTGRRGSADDRSPVQRPGVGVRRRCRGAGRRLARSAPPQHVARGGRPDGC